VVDVSRAQLVASANGYAVAELVDGDRGVVEGFAEAVGVELKGLQRG
jgi:hypothetical protein